MIRIFTLLSIVISICTTVFAQQTPQYSLFMLNPYNFNPAYAGLENSLEFNAVYRKQWTDLTGAPETQHINAHLPVYIISSGIGMKVENDKIGAHRRTKALLSYSYQREINRNNIVSLGFSGGYMQYSLDGSKLRSPEGTYEQTTGSVINHNDPNLPEGKIQAGVPVFEAGIYWQGKKVDFGISSLPLYIPKTEIDNKGTLQLQVKQYFGATVIGKFEIGENLLMKPSLAVKTDLVATQAEISTIFKYRDNIMTGASFRGFGNKAKDAIVVLFGLNLNDKTSFAYSFDFPLSSLRASNRGSHEILLKYNLNQPIGKGKLPPIIYNQRYD
jgi:type IX secretion system PorP/SprF family membrane protein